jgi:excisionase family DNA binding protein
MTAGLEMEISKTEFALVVQEAVERGVATALSLRPRPSSVNFEQAAEMLCLSSKTVSTMVRDGRIRANKIGRIPVSEIDKALSASNPGSGRRSAK